MIHLQAMRDEMSACKLPIIDLVYLSSTTRTFVIDLSSTTTMFAIIQVNMISPTSHMIYHATLKVKGYSYAKFY